MTERTRMSQNFAKPLMLFSLFVGLTLCACTRYNNQSLAQSSGSSLKGEASVFDGTYQFVSEVTDLTAPKKRHDERRSQEWDGTWLFRAGYFSQTYAKRQRLEWTPSHFPDDPRDLGFDAAFGKYKLQGDTIQLDYDLTFYPGKAGRREILKYHFEGNTLTLTQELLPSRESAATGQRIVVLRKVN
jgi:hypothetical protein